MEKEISKQQKQEIEDIWPMDTSKNERFSLVFILYSSMKAAPFYKILETKSCEVFRAKIAKIGNRNHMPDFFLLFFYVTLLCSSILPDATIAYGLFAGNNLSLFVFFVLTVVTRIILEVYLEEKNPSSYIPEGISRAKVQLVFYLCGAGSLVICRKILLETYSNQRPPVKRSTLIQNPSFRVFHISRDSVHFIKMYFVINLALKSLPQLMLLPVLILEYSPEVETRIAAMTSILINIAIFSATVSLLFPIRDTPRVYKSLTCVSFEGISKFLAASCACCESVVVFVVLYKALKNYALSIYIFKFLIWVWPCWRSIRFQKMRKLYMAVYLTLITFIATVIYIHPFKGYGKLFYYPFYLIHFLFELAYIYLSADPDFVVLSYFFTLKILMLSFLSSYALMNVIHKKDTDLVQRSSITSEVEAEATGEAEVWRWREHI